MSIYLISGLRSPIVLGLALTGLLMLTGCFGSPVGATGREVVEGVVYCGRQPLDAGTVRFEPADQASSLPIVSAAIQSNGEFQLGTDPGEEVLPGRYRVIVTDAAGNAEGEVRSRAGQVCLYGDTGQIAQVIAGGKNQFRFVMPGPDGPRDAPEGE